MPANPSHGISVLRLLAGLRDEPDLHPHLIVRDAINFWATRINQSRGVPFADVVDTVDRLAKDRPLDALQHSDEHRDLTHVAKTLRELSLDGSTLQWWRETCQRWPIFVEARTLALDELRQSRAAQRATTPPTDSGTVEPATKTRAATAIDAAIGLLAKHPDWTDAAIAEAARCSASNLSKNKRFQMARKAVRGVGEESHNRSKQNRGADMDEYADDNDQPDLRG
jgi:hypothetical protein